MNYNVTFALFLPILFFAKTSCEIPDEVKHLCTHLDELNKFMRNLWTIKANVESDEKDNYKKNKTTINKVIDGKQNFNPLYNFVVGIHFKNDYQSKPQCGGVLIDPNWILTSENCLA